MMNESLSIDFDSEAVAQAATATFARHGLSVMRSFDLRSALSGQPGCECAQHGTAKCHCQYTVLLVYGEAGTPATLTLHSHDRQTYARIIRDSATTPDPRLAEQIITALVEVAFTLHTTFVPPARSVAHAG